MVIVQPRLANGRNFRVFSQDAQCRKKVLDLILDVGGMNADDGIDIGIFLGQSDGSLAAFDSGANGDNPCHAGICRAPNHLIKVVGKLRIVEMGMGIDQHGFNCPCHGGVSWQDLRPIPPHVAYICPLAQDAQVIDFRLAESRKKLKLHPIDRNVISVEKHRSAHIQPILGRLTVAKPPHV